MPNTEKINSQEMDLRKCQVIKTQKSKMYTLPHWLWLHLEPTTLQRVVHLQNNWKNMQIRYFGQIKEKIHEPLSMGTVLE